MSKPTTIVVGGHTIMLTRRAYPRSTGGWPTFFTWADVLVKDEWVSLGDPWQKLRPSNKELLEAVKVATEQRRVRR